MTAIWQHLDDNQRAVLACLLTGVVGLFIGAVWAWFAVRPHNRAPIADVLDVAEYRTHVDDVYDQEAEPDLAVAALRAELDAWGTV